MTAKQKLLPRPCPICKRKNGTFQLVVFLNSFHRMGDIVCRVRHYDSKKYKQEKQTLSQNKRNHILPVKSPRRGQFWHSFRVSGLKSGNDMFKYYTQDEINIPYNFSYDAKSWAFGMSQKLYDEIKYQGWNPLPDHSWRYKGRPRKDT